MSQKMNWQIHISFDPKIALRLTLNRAGGVRSDPPKFWTSTIIKWLNRLFHKFLRQFRLNLSRKTSQYDNLYDVFKRLWKKSDPLINKAEKHCSSCGLEDHSVRSCKNLSEKFSCETEFEALISMLMLN